MTKYILNSAIQLAEYASEPDKENDVACENLVDALQKFIYVKNNSESPIGHQDHENIVKATAQLKVLKLDALLTLIYRGRTDFSGILFKDLEHVHEESKRVLEDINRLLEAAKDWSEEEIAAKTVELSVSSGMISKAVELSRYCDRPHLKQIGRPHLSLTDRIRRLLAPEDSIFA